jgi:predicted  nucleic acid-binding Zn-ribbon protein
VSESRLNKDILITFKTNAQRLNKLVKSQQESIISLSKALDSCKQDRRRLTEEAAEAQKCNSTLKQTLSEMQDSFSLSVFKLKEELQRAEESRAEINELHSTIHSLQIRAAVNFEDLTPRPELRSVRGI